MAVGGWVLEDHGIGLGVWGRCVWAVGGCSAGASLEWRVDWPLYWKANLELATKVKTSDIIKPMGKAIINTLTIAHGRLRKRLFVVRVTIWIIIVQFSILMLLVVPAAIVILIIVVIHVVIEFTACIQRLLVLLFIVKSILALQVLLTQLSDSSMIGRSMVVIRRRTKMKTRLYEKRWLKNNS